jgi:hypothetical protein
VTGGYLYEKISGILALQMGEERSVVGGNDKALTEFKERPGKIEILPAMEIGKQAAKVCIAGCVFYEEDSAMVIGYRLASDNGLDSGFLRLVQEVGDAVQAISVGQRHAVHSKGTGGRAQCLRMMDPPPGGEG